MIVFTDQIITVTLLITTIFLKTTRLLGTRVLECQKRVKPTVLDNPRIKVYIVVLCRVLSLFFSLIRLVPKWRRMGFGIKKMTSTTFHKFNFSLSLSVKEVKWSVNTVLLFCWWFRVHVPEQKYDFYDD